MWQGTRTVPCPRRTTSYRRSYFVRTFIHSRLLLSNISKYRRLFEYEYASNKLLFIYFLF